MGLVKDREARATASQAYAKATLAYDKAVRVYSGVKTGCYDGQCDAFDIYIKTVTELVERVEALEKKSKKVCKSCGQERS